MEKRISETSRVISARRADASSRVCVLVADRLDLVDDVAEADDLLGDAVVHLARDAVALLGRGQRAHLVEQDGGVEAYGELVGDLAGTLVELGRPPRHADDHAVAQHLLGAAQRDDGRAGRALGVRDLDLLRQPLDVVAAVERAERAVGVARRRWSSARRPWPRASPRRGPWPATRCRARGCPSWPAGGCRAIRWWAAAYGAWRAAWSRVERDCQLASRPDARARSASHGSGVAEPRSSASSRGSAATAAATVEAGDQGDVERRDQAVAHAGDDRRARRGRRRGSAVASAWRRAASSRPPPRPRRASASAGCASSTPAATLTAATQREHHQHRRRLDERAVAEHGARRQGEREHADGRRRPPRLERRPRDARSSATGRRHARITCC